jgi:hypothetical protein
MRPPPLLLGAALLFWGWQAGLLWVGAGMGALVELAILIKARWDFSDEDFERIWTLCSLLLLAMVVFAFTQNDGLSTFSNLMSDADRNAQRGATLATARTASNVLRWLPMVFFPFLLAQTFSTRETIPLATISHILQRRWKLAQRLGQSIPPSRGFNVGYPYFCMVLLAASFHAAEDNTYFWGFCGLLGWALWSLRSRRYSLAVWAAILVVAGIAGYFGQRGISQAQRYLVGFNAQWLARFLRRSDDPFQSRTAIGRVGAIKNSSAIAVRLLPRTPRDVPMYLREATYRRYERQIWFAGSSRDDFTTVTETLGTSTNLPYWPLVPDKATTAAVQIACYLDGSENGIPSGTLPLPSGTARLDKFPGFALKLNTAGAVLAQGPGLLIFDAHFGPGPTFDSPPGTNTRRGSQRVLPTPAEETPSALTNGPPDESRSDSRRRRFVANEDIDVTPAEAVALDAVIAELQLEGLPYQQVLTRLTAFFNDKFTYSIWQGPFQRLVEDETPLARFLLRARSGHCEYFATATVLLLRRLEIPARYATGYAVHEQSGDGYVVRFSDAHAWTLVWDQSREIWEDFDTTPASWVEAERSGFAVLRWLGDGWGRIKFELAKFRYGQSSVRKYLLWIVVPGLALLLYQIVFRRGRKRQLNRKQDDKFFANWPGLDSDFYRLEKQLATRGVMRGEAEPLGDWLRRVVETPGLADLRAPLDEVLRLHYRHRFDPLGLDAPAREALRQETSRCLETLATLGAVPAV